MCRGTSNLRTDGKEADQHGSLPGVCSACGAVGHSACSWCAAWEWCQPRQAGAAGLEGDELDEPAKGSTGKQHAVEQAVDVREVELDVVEVLGAWTYDAVACLPVRGHVPRDCER